MIHPVYLSDTINLQDSTYQCEGEELSIETLKFYLSHFSFKSNGEHIYADRSGHHLIDASEHESLSFFINRPTYKAIDTLEFTLGVDSLTSVSGVFGGALDPTNGMYWAWNSGYINFKLEGQSPQSKGRNQFFQFHLGGYAHPYSSAVNVSLPTNNSHEIHLYLDVSNFIDMIDLSKTHKIMSPSHKAVDLSQELAKLFFLND